MKRDTCILKKKHTHTGVDEGEIDEVNFPSVIFLF